MSNDKTQEKSSRQNTKRGGGGRFGSTTIEAPKNLGNATKRLINYFGGQAFVLIIIFIFVVITTFLRVIGPAFIGIAIDKLTLFIKEEQDVYVNEFLRYMFIILFVYVGAWITGALQGIMMTRITNNVIFRLRRDAFNHIQTLSMSYFDKRGIGDIISRLTNDIEKITQFLSNGLINLTASLFSIVGYLVIMVILNHILSIVVLATIPVMIIITGIIAKRVRVAFRENQAQIGKLSANIQESIAGVKVIKTFHRENEEFNKFEHINEDTRKIGIRAETISYAFMPIMTTMSSIILSLVLIVGGNLVLNEFITIGLLTSFILYSRRFLEPLRQITNVYNVMQSALAGAERIFQLLDAKPDIVNKKDAKLLTDINGNVEFENVKFGYVENKIVLNGINLTAKKGQVVALVGPTGAGKTTIINLLSRFYDVWDGNIKLDGYDIRDIEIKSLRTSMGVVLQEPFFFASTIKDNLLYGNPNTTLKDMIEAAKLANADHFIRRLPKKYYTELTERGMNLSQGERQLLAITRAILADPKILILDEATSNIDSLTEAHIQQGLLELMKGRTSFIIAHRLSTIKKADKVIVIHNHKIIEEGTHKELMEKQGFYSRLYRLQLKKDMDNLTEDMEI